MNNKAALDYNTKITSPAQDLKHLSANNVLRINTQAIIDNYKKLQSIVGKKCTVSAVVKANAYGLGIDHIAPKLEQAGCDFFYVGSPDEALALTKLTNKTIAMLNGPVQGFESDLIAHGIIPTLNSLGEIENWYANAQTKHLPAIWHFDTGMSRLGLKTDEMKTLVARIENDNDFAKTHRPFMIMSHLACAEKKNNALNYVQLRRIERIASYFPNIPISFANSSGIFCGADYQHAQVRAGAALYGLNPAPHKTNPLIPAISYSARILQISNVGFGDSAGYGATHIFDKETSIATVAAGYKDGFPRSAGNKAEIYINGTACPVVGNVSMDLTTIDIGHLKNKPSVGDYAELIGPNQSADTLANAAGTIGYEFLTSLGNSSYKIYE